MDQHTDLALGNGLKPRQMTCNIYKHKSSNEQIDQEGETEITAEV